MGPLRVWLAFVSFAKTCSKFIFTASKQRNFVFHDESPQLTIRTRINDNRFRDRSLDFNHDCIDHD